MSCTMNKFLLAVAVFCLASQLVTGQCCFGLGKKITSKIPIDFDNLDSYLLKTCDYSRESNIAQLRSNLKKLGGGIRRAADIILELVDARECNEKLLVTLNDAASNSINNMNRTRVWRVTRSHLGRTMSLCKAYIDEQVPRRYEAADEALKQFTRHVGPHVVDWSTKGPIGGSLVASDDVEDTPDVYELLYNNKFEVPFRAHQEWPASIDANQLSFFMVELAKLAGDTMDYAGGDKQNFESAFQKYLLKPCEQFEATFGTLLEAFRAVAFFKGLDGVEFVQERSGHLRRLAYTHKVCLAVQIVDHNDDRKHGFDYNKQDLLQSLVSWFQS